MFSVLGRREIEGRSRVILEGEAGVNDPAGIALMIGMIELATHSDASLLVLARELAVEMSIGVALGVAGGVAFVPLLRRIRLPSASLSPVLALSLAGALYGTTALARGSGFLAVFIAGLFVGEAEGQFKHEVARFHGSLAALAELVVFVGLGLTVSIGSLSGGVWVDGAIIAGIVGLLVRPVVVMALLAPARLRLGERAFIAWSGLKGAVPILLAAFAVLADVTGAGRVYGLVFVVVLVSVVGQGTLVPLAARALRVPMREHAAA
jgi:cell volume regulation protein A